MNFNKVRARPAAVAVAAALRSSGKTCEIGLGATTNYGPFAH